MAVVQAAAKKWGRRTSHGHPAKLLFVADPLFSDGRTREVAGYRLPYSNHIKLGYAKNDQQHYVQTSIAPGGPVSAVRRSPLSLVRLSDRMKQATR